jgi:hypothetical protein
MLDTLKKHAGMAGLIVAILALFVAITGIAGALPGKKSVDKNDLKKNSVASKNVAADTLTGGDIKESTLELPASVTNTFGVHGGVNGDVIKSTVDGVTVKKDGGGAFTVTFQQNISNCIPVVSGSSSAPVTVRAYVVGTNQVFVGLGGDTGFQLIVKC